MSETECVWKIEGRLRDLLSRIDIETDVGER